ncbi:MAG: ABC transporter substrate-binding protein, partial [Thermoplasmatales archaeon]
MAFSQTRILSLIPLTGGAATWGVEYNNSFTLAAEQINSSTTEDNEKVMIYTEDTKCNPNVAVSVLRSGIAKYSPDFIIEGICSGDVLAQAKIVNQAKIPFIVSGASADEIRDSGEFIFRIIPSDTAVARFGANYLISAGCKNVFLISEKTSYAQGMKNLLRNSMANQVTLTLEDYLSGERDFSSIIMKLKRTNPDCIIFNGQTPSSNGLLIGRLGQQFTNLNAKRFVFYSAGNQDLIEA